MISIIQLFIWTFSITIIDHVKVTEIVGSSISIKYKNILVPQVNFIWHTPLNKKILVSIIQLKELVLMEDCYSSLRLFGGKILYVCGQQKLFLTLAT